MSSYIQIELGGKLEGLKFNQGALIMFREKVDLENYMATSGYALIWAGLKSNYYAKGIEFLRYQDEEIEGKTVSVGKPITFEMVCDWVDKLPETVAVKVATVFQESQVYQDILEKGKSKELSEDEKKNISETIDANVSDLPGD